VSTEESTEVEENTETKAYTSEELNAMTVAQIKALATELGYTITATTKANIIAEFLEQQG